jgi:isoleucyl-tRNA synthetase
MFDIGDDGVSNIYTLLCDSYVDMNSSVGTGAVHLAPAFGEDDFRVCLEHNIITPETIGDFCPVNDEGKFTSTIKSLEGMLVTDKSTNDEIIKLL